jgi:hypothetical protein
LEGNLERALRHIRKFSQNVQRLIGEINASRLVEKAGLNPYMLAALNISSFEDVAELFVYKHVERSLGTSFGNVIEAFLRDLLGGRSGKEYPQCKGRQKPWICWWDIVIERELEKNGKKYKGIVISVKSGPADINKDIVERFIEHAQEAEKAGYKPYLVLTYGKRAFTVAETTLRSWGLNPREYLLVGREMFREFLGDSSYYEQVIDAIRESSTGINIFDLINAKIKELSDELKRLYGNDISRLLKDLT